MPCTFCRCFLKPLLPPNCSLHPSTLHRNAFCPRWIWWCAYLAEWVLKLWSQPSMLHLNGFSPVWTLSCCERLVFEVNARPHVLQMKLRISKWTRFLWPSHSDLDENRLKHVSHSNFFSYGRWTDLMWNLRYLLE